MADSDQKNGTEVSVSNSGGIVRLIREYGSGTTVHGIFGTIGSIGSGAMLPFFCYYFGDMITVGTDEDVDYKAQALRFLITFLLIGLVSLICNVLQYVCWGIYGAKISVRARERCFQNLLRQDIGYYDEKNSGAINTELISNCLSVAGMGTAIGISIQSFISFIGGFVLAF